MQVFGFGIFILGQSMSFSITIQIMLLHILTMYLVIYILFLEEFQCKYFKVSGVFVNSEQKLSKKLVLTLVWKQIQTLYVFTERCNATLKKKIENSAKCSSYQ